MNIRNITVPILLQPCFQHYFFVTSDTFLQMIHGPPQALRSSDLIDGRRSDLVDGLRNHFDPMSQSQISESNTGARKGCKPLTKPLFICSLKNISKIYQNLSVVLSLIVSINPSVYFCVDISVLSVLSVFNF